MSKLEAKRESSPERSRPEAARPERQAPARRGGDSAPERSRPEAARPDRQAPAESPRDVAEARAAVEMSRARISATIDELEERIVDKKEELRDRLDVVRPVRALVAAAPLVALGIAAGTGLLLGLASRGGRKRRREVELSEVDRDALLRWRRARRKRLLDTAEHELPRFDRPSRLGRLVRDLAHEFAGAATAMLASQLVDRVKEERD